MILKCFFKGDEIIYIGEEKTADFINKLLVKISSIGRSKAGVFLGVKFAKKGITNKNKQINREIDQLRDLARSIVNKRIK